jgi:serpin B
MGRLALRPPRGLCLLPVFTVVLFLFAGCSARVGGKVLQSKKQRILWPDVKQSELQELVTGNTGFAFELYRALRKKSSNLFYSPSSISTALAMTYAGARGQTERQMADTLHFALPQNRLHPAFNALHLRLDTRHPSAESRDDEAFRLHIVDAIWGQTGYSFLPEFLDLLAENYGAGLRLLDFAKEPEPSRASINKWVSRETEGRIRDLLPAGSVDSLARLVLTDAIYFKAKWLYEFEKGATHPGAFRLLDGKQVTVDMMSQTKEFGYAEGEGYQAVELPYRGRQLSMVILLPREGRFREFENSLDSERVKAMVGGLASRSVHLTMPRFRYESGCRLKDVLSAMGMPDAFGAAADFSGMDGTRRLFIDGVYHKAFVAVDEAGTEAAAATGVVMRLGIASTSPVELTIDRPFIFMIRDIATGAILFVGRVLNPRA